MKKFISILLSLITIFSSLSSNNITVFAENNLNISSNYAILMEYETGDILFERNAHERIAPASTTKTWTAYVVLKYVDDLSEVIEIKDFEPVEGSSMYLKNGERFTVKQLLDALLVQSANDVSVVLAEFVSGSVEEFCKLMTEEAKLIGAVNTNFSNPHGLDDINHYTTPYDMVLMSREAMNIDIFREIVQTTEITYESNEYSEIARAFSNTNQFLHESSPYYYEAVDGIKTGTTDDAGRCLVSSAVKDNRRLIAGVFKANDDSLYSDSRSLLDYGFENFTSHTILNKDKYLKSESIFLSKEGALTYSPNLVIRLFYQMIKILMNIHLTKN